MAGDRRGGSYFRKLRAAALVAPAVVACALASPAGAAAATDNVSLSGAYLGTYHLVPGTTLYAGYAVEPASTRTSAETVSVQGAAASVALSCAGSSAQLGTLSFGLRDGSYAFNGGAPAWQPAVDPSQPGSYQGSGVVPDLCSGQSVVVYGANAAGGRFSADVLASDASQQVSIRFGTLGTAPPRSATNCPGSDPTCSAHAVRSPWTQATVRPDATAQPTDGGGGTSVTPPPGGGTSGGGGGTGTVAGGPSGAAGDGTPAVAGTRPAAGATAAPQQQPRGSVPPAATDPATAPPVVDPPGPGSASGSGASSAPPSVASTTSSLLQHLPMNLFAALAVIDVLMAVLILRRRARALSRP